MHPQKRGTETLSKHHRLLYTWSGRVLKDLRAVSVVSCRPYRLFAAFIVLWHYSLGYSLQLSVKIMSSGIRFINIGNISFYLVFSTPIRVRWIFGHFCICKENKSNFFDGTRRVLTFDSICIQASVLLACFDFSNHQSNFPVFRKLTSANFRHVKEKEKSTIKKTSCPEFLLQLIHLMKGFWLNEENVLPWLADRLQQLLTFL